MMKLVLMAILLLGTTVAQSQKQEEHYQEMRRTACLILSRYHSNTKVELIQETIKSLPAEDQQSYINKIYAIAVQTCEPQITPEQVQEFYTDKEAFDPSNMFYILENMSYEQIVNDLTIDKNQEKIVKFIHKFDQENEIRNEERKDQREKGEGDDTMDMKVLGISIKSIPSSAKLIYVLLIVSLACGGLYYAFGEVTKKKEKANNKRRKSPTRLSPSKSGKKE